MNVELSWSDRFFSVHSVAKVWVLTIALTASVSVIIATDCYFAYPDNMRWIVMQRAVPFSAVLTFVITNFVFRRMLLTDQLRQKLQQMVERDRLTDVATRDFFFSKLSVMPDRKGVSMMVDIDFFKQVNDTYGHLVGDKVIAKVAAALQQEVRREDIVCRFGGEEFVVFLNDADAALACDIAERIRLCIASTAVEAESVVVNVTASVGVSSVQVARQIDTAIKQADDALYRAKAEGRNRVVVHDAQSPVLQKALP